MTTSSASSETASEGDGGATVDAASERPTAPPPRLDRDPDLVLARAHLRLGALGLARTELETLAGRGTLDDEAVRDLAEARWRTGDVLGAGEAATAWLEGHGDDILGLVIAAEAQAALGRPGEARRLAGRAVDRADGSLDPIFAGMQRSPIWPVEAGDGGAPVGVLFDELHPGPLPVGPVGGGPGHPTWADDDGSAPDRFDQGGPAFGAGPSLWGDDEAGLATTFEEELEPADLLQRARVALDDGAIGDAATGLILALRASPAVAPAVLDLVAGRSEAILVLLRGDAQRIVGRELEAMRDHSAAAGSLPEGRTADETAEGTTDGATDDTTDEDSATPDDDSPTTDDVTDEPDSAPDANADTISSDPDQEDS